MPVIENKSSRIARRIQVPQGLKPTFIGGIYRSAKALRHPGTLALAAVIAVLKRCATHVHLHWRYLSRL